MQTRTRFPDSAEWECIELQGANVCHSEVSAAGIEPGPIDAGFVCGARRGHAGERVCVDFAPDVPDDSAWVCHMERTQRGVERHCEKKSSHTPGAACSAEAACVGAARCIEGVCIPPRPEPSCWLDADCSADARCHWGTCTT